MVLGSESEGAILSYLSRPAFRSRATDASLENPPYGTDVSDPSTTFWSRYALRSLSAGAPGAGSALANSTVEATS